MNSAEMRHMASNLLSDSQRLHKESARCLTAGDRQSAYDFKEHGNGLWKAAANLYAEAMSLNESSS